MKRLLTFTLVGYWTHWNPILELKSQSNLTIIIVSSKLPSVRWVNSSDSPSFFVLTLTVVDIQSTVSCSKSNLSLQLRRYIVSVFKVNKDLDFQTSWRQHFKSTLLIGVATASCHETLYKLEMSPTSWPKNKGKILVSLIRWRRLFHYPLLFP